MSVHCIKEARERRCGERKADYVKEVVSEMPPFQCLDCGSLCHVSGIEFSDESGQTVTKCCGTEYDDTRVSD